MLTKEQITLSSAETNTVTIEELVESLGVVEALRRYTSLKHIEGLVAQVDRATLEKQDLSVN